MSIDDLITELNAADCRHGVSVGCPDCEERTWTLTHFDRPWTVNTERQWYFYARAQAVAEWRQAFFALAMEAKVPRLDCISVTVTPFYKGNASRPDVAACATCAKAAIDGLVDAKVIPDDDPDHLISVTFLQPVMGAKRCALVLTIETA